MLVNHIQNIFFNILYIPIIKNIIKTINGLTLIYFAE